MAHELLGDAVTGRFGVAGGEAQLFERGAVVTGAAGEFEVRFDWPAIGIPSIGTGAAASATPFGRSTIRFREGRWSPPEATAAVVAAIQGRVALKATGGNAMVPLVPGTAEPLPAPAIRLPNLPGLPDTSPRLGLSVTASLAERQLYDVVIRQDDGAWRVVAPHAVYFRSSWHDFGIGHITDIHASRRIDGYRALLRQHGTERGAAGLNNWNDRFRGFIRYANALHAEGRLDVILATGDIIDFQFEDGDDPNGGGNALFARKILLGQMPGPDFPDVEELRVPIFMVPGNHDYRKYPYKLVFDLNVAHKDLARLRQFSGLNIANADALLLTRGDTGDDVPNVGSGDAAKMIEVDESNRAFRAHLADRPSYTVRLGDHRIAMLDSGPDVGMLTGIGDGIRKFFGALSEDEETFSDGSPNSVGVGDDELAMVQRELAATPVNGLFLVGLHAPLLNVVDTNFAPYLRETQRPALATQVTQFLARTDWPELKPHPTWQSKAGLADPPDFIAWKDNADNLDFGVSRGKANELLNVLAGIGMPRKADVVLHGHIHTDCEVRLAVEAGSLVFRHDFYTENPPRYYPKRYGPAISPRLHAGGPKPPSEVTYLDVVPGAPKNGQPWKMPYEAKYPNTVQIPPYPDPLESTTDVSAWWNHHRPLVIQSAPLGPMESNQQSFAGFRLLEVKRDRIERIRHVSIERLEANGFRLPWDQAIAKEGRAPWEHWQRSLALGAPGSSGSPFGYKTPNGLANIVYRDGKGHLREIWRNADDSSGTGDLTAGAGAPPAANEQTVYLDPQTGHQIVIYRGTDGHVHSLYWTTGTVGHDALSASAGAPKATGTPTGWFNPVRNEHHVVYRAENGHLEELWWAGQGAVGHGDLMASVAAPAAAGDPAPFVTKKGDNIVAYRGTDGGIHSLYWGTIPLGHDALSAVARTPKAAGDPSGYYSEFDDAHQIVYRAENGHVYELWWVGTGSVQGWDLTAVAGAPPAASDPLNFYSPETREKYVVYRTADDHVHAIHWIPGAGDPVYTDLTLFSHAMPAVGTVRGFNGPTHRHVVYQGSDGHVQEIRWQAGLITSPRVATLPNLPGWASGGLPWGPGHGNGTVLTSGPIRDHRDDPRPAAPSGDPAGGDPAGGDPPIPPRTGPRPPPRGNDPRVRDHRK